MHLARREVAPVHHVGDGVDKSLGRVADLRGVSVLLGRRVRRGEQLRSFDAAGVRADEALLTMSQFEGNEDIVEYDILI